METFGFSKGKSANGTEREYLLKHVDDIEKMLVFSESGDKALDSIDKVYKEFETTQEISKLQMEELKQLVNLSRTNSSSELTLKITDKKNEIHDTETHLDQLEKEIEVFEKLKNMQ